MARKITPRILPGDGDRRHGTLRGYAIGCPGKCCREANRKMGSAYYHRTRAGVAAEHYADLLRQEQQKHGPLISAADVRIRTGLAELKFLYRYLGHPVTRVMIGSRTYLRVDEMDAAEQAWRKARSVRKGRIDFDGHALRVARETSGMRQTDVADALGIHFSAVSLWEKGRRHPLLRHLKQLEELFPGAKLVKEAADGEVHSSVD